MPCFCVHLRGGAAVQDALAVASDALVCSDGRTALHVAQPVAHWPQLLEQARAQKTFEQACFCP